MRALHAPCFRLSVAASLAVSFSASFAGTFGCSRAEGDPRAERSAQSAAREDPDAGPIVLELFTSQGCSSCPPAEQLLSRLATAGALDGRAVAPLAFHVDYWNDLGWSDPFSLPAWTERQHAYSRSIGDDRVYTPELVVGGRAGVIGSDLAAVSEAIRRSTSPARLVAEAVWSADAVTVTATAPGGADVWVAIWEDAAATRVTRGENAGETLSGARVVRRLERVAAAGQHTTCRDQAGAWLERRGRGRVRAAHRSADRRLRGAAARDRGGHRPRPNVSDRAPSSLTAR